MRKVFVLCLCLTSQILSAQVQAPGLPHTTSPAMSEANRRYQQQIFEQWASGGDQAKSAARADADARAQQFYEKARHFVEVWRSFAMTLNDRSAFDAKLAKKVSKAFHDLEKSEGWPVGRDK